MITFVLIAALAAPLLASQTPTITAAPEIKVERMALPDMPGIVVDPSCGGRAFIASIATCVVSTQDGLQAVADRYTTAFEGQGWLQAYGTDNRMIFIKRREGGGCDGFQVQAFTDDTVPAGPAVPAYIAFATIPGDVCADPDASGATPQ